MKHIGKERALSVAHKMITELVYNMAKLEGNSLTFAETQTVMDGISIAGKPMKDLHQVEHIQAGWKYLIHQTKTDTFNLSKDNFIQVNAIVAEGENPTPGQFRDTHVRISGTDYMPPMPMLLDSLFREMIDSQQSPLDLFLDTARNQYFGDGNKRTGQLMMNGVLMSQGFAPISISPKAQQEYLEYLIAFYESGDKRVMTEFLLEQQQRYIW